MSAPLGHAEPTAVQGRRIGAWIIDVVIIMALGFLVSLAFPIGDQVPGNVCEQRGVSDPVFDSDDIDTRDATTNEAEICFDDGDWIVFSNDSSAVVNAGNTLWPNLVVLAYIVIVFWVWQGLTGLTPGKGIVGIRTVNAEGQAPGVLRAFVRWVLWIVDAFPYCCAPLVGGITMLASEKHQRVGDMVARTYVVDKASMGAGALDGPHAASVPPPAAGAFAAPPPTTPGTLPPTPDQPSEPQWDQQREAYVQWDPSRQAWVQFDDVTQTWKPIT